METFSERLIRLWNEWELRVLILMSLSFQIFLTLFGSSRKRVAAKSVIFLLWSVYLLADAVAITALGVIARSQGNSDSGDHQVHSSQDDLNSQLIAFWSPILLLHLGGPDSITAFSSQDNELWLRHLFILMVEVGLAAYVFCRSLVPGSQLWFLSIPMFIAGIIKYGERTFVLMSSSMEHFKNSVIFAPGPGPESGPDYVNLVKDYASQIAQGSPPDSDFLVMMATARQPHDYSHAREDNEASVDHEAHRFFGTVKRLFFDLVLSFRESSKSYSFFRYASFVDAFKVIEMELLLMYDALYTKASLIHTRKGSILRFISFSCILSVLMTFMLVVEKRDFLDIDIVITYILLGSALFIEICQLILQLVSLWTAIRLHKYRSHPLLALPYEVLCSKVESEQAWSNSVAQFNLVRFCIKDKPTMFKSIQQLFNVKENMDKYLYTTYKVVSDDVKKFIFNQILARAGDESGTKYDGRGERVIWSSGFNNKLRWSVETEFDRSIILWHFATDLFYHSDLNQVLMSDTSNFQCRVSKLLSEYLLYLLGTRSFMLTTPIGRISFRDTCSEAKTFLHKKESVQIETEARTRLLGVNTEVDPIIIKVDTSKSVLSEACILWKLLKEITMEKKWEIISGVWVEMLLYAASQSKGIYHAQQLCEGGGGLLTRVWLLMALLRMTEHSAVTGYSSDSDSEFDF